MSAVSTFLIFNLVRMKGCQFLYRTDRDGSFSYPGASDLLFCQPDEVGAILEAWGMGWDQEKQMVCNKPTKDQVVKSNHLSKYHTHPFALAQAKLR